MLEQSTCIWPVTFLIIPHTQLFDKNVTLILKQQIDQPVNYILEKLGTINGLYLFCSRKAILLAFNCT